MSSNTISGSCFALNALNECAYELDIQFLDTNGSLTSQKQFNFSKQTIFQNEEILDIYSQNGNCSDFVLKTLFEKDDVKGIQKALTMVGSYPLSGPTILVLDLQDPHKHHYLCNECSKETIAKSEKVVTEFFQSKNLDKFENNHLNKHAKKIHEYFQGNISLDYILNEGSLKQGLLESGVFSEAEITYFQNPGSGPINFCQCAEFFMIGIKSGYSAKSSAGVFEGNQYVTNISNKFESFKPFSKSTVLYPALYKDTYSLQGTFASLIKPIFSVSGKFDEKTKITTMTLEKKS